MPRGGSSLWRIVFQRCRKSRIRMISFIVHRQIIQQICSVEEFVENLISNQKWWYGSNCFLQNCNYWLEKSVKQSQVVGNSEILRQQKVDSVICFVFKVVIEKLTNEISVWSSLQSVVAWCLKFMGNSRGNRVSTPYLECLELKELHDRIIHLVLKVAFSTDISVLEKGNVLSAGKLIQLNPFLDSKGLLRVGGRIGISSLPASVKHPLILPKQHPVTTMIIRLYHLYYLHAGVQSVHSAIRQVYWILGARSSIRKIVRNYVIYARFRAGLSRQIMADLPASPVIKGRAFLRVGTDFCGPFLITPRRGRGVRPVKMYVCVFVCFITKAVHLEQVSDLSTDAFLASFKRFVGRRGKPAEIFSDCETNFVGAKMC
ncbi:hypothetical protein HNY73_004121 [Argiope bruennichi]|uniref:Integrase zinc-binding domain-containing protein n=1 Tax=Argiope bruennichi TaxID=94029 RepID=A0A8T0FMX2_ARGBR|nr:hypothetical protein HNY73_004121 [Argiope bruennichi]